MRVIKAYLEDGPDIYTVDKLRRYATQETGAYKVYDFLLVVCVHKLAAQLGVYSLTNLVYTVLYQSECSVTTRDLHIYIYIYIIPLQPSPTDIWQATQRFAHSPTFQVDPGEHIAPPRIVARATPLEEISTPNRIHNCVLPDHQIPPSLSTAVCYTSST